MTLSAEEEAERKELARAVRYGRTPVPRYSSSGGDTDDVAPQLDEEAEKVKNARRVEHGREFRYGRVSHRRYIDDL